MSPEEEVARLKALCEQVADEKDPERFSALLEELGFPKDDGKSPKESRSRLTKTA